MPDVELDDFRQGSDGLSAGVIEPMTGMHLETEGLGQSCALADALPLHIRCRRVAVRQRVAPGAGVNLNDRSAERRRRLDLPLVGSNEQRNPDTGGSKVGNFRLELGAPTGGIES